MKKSTGQTASIAKEIKEQKEVIVMDEFEKFLSVYEEEVKKIEGVGEWKYDDDVMSLKINLVKEYFSKPFADVINLLAIPADKIEECKEIITDPKLLGRYYNMKKFFYDPYYMVEDPIEGLLARAKDFDIKKITSINNQIIFLKKLKNAVGIEERVDLTMSKVISEDDAKKLWLEYTSIRRVRTKENHFLYQAGVKKQIIVMYKDLFGVDSIITKNTTKKNEKTGKLDKITSYQMNEEYYEQMKMIFNFSTE